MLTKLPPEESNVFGARFPVLVIAMTLFVLPVLAADRHVFLDTNGNGQLNDCPNPAHNAKGTSNTDELQWCNGGTATKKIIGAAAGTTTASACTSGGGAVLGLTNGTQVDIDRDGIAERVYGHPQACVYNMAKSDSCETHAGTYSKPGASCPGNCGDFSQIGIPEGTCSDVSCWFASVLAWGFGPNLDGNGYGTATSPGYLRGAVMNGSTDTWDTNGDKVPDGTYAPIISGDSNVNGGAAGVFDLTVCTGTSCSGDIYHPLIVGCGGGGDDPAWTWKTNCPIDPRSGSEEYVKIDSDADGTFDLQIDARTLAPVPSPNTRPRSVDYFQVKDIEFKGYNQGAGSVGQVPKLRTGAINLNGDGQADGLKLDHIAFHGNAYGSLGSVRTEHTQAGITDMWNRGCADYTEIKNSFLEQNNRLLFADEGTPAGSLGCSWLIHDNRILVNVLTYDSNLIPALGFFKSVDYHANNGRPKTIRFYNNEVMYQQNAPGHNMGTTFIFGQLGNSGGRGKGEFWMYGNIFRNRSDVANTVRSFYTETVDIDCSGCSTLWRGYSFNNVFDGWSANRSVPMDAFLRARSAAVGESWVEKNNVMVFTTEEEDSVYSANATSVLYDKNAFADASKCAGTGRYFVCGNDPLSGSGLAYYTPFAGGGLAGIGSCDPDGDGVAGVDWNGDGTNDTTWQDIAGNAVSCPTATSPIAIGAIQGASSSTNTDPPATVERVRRADKP